MKLNAATQSISNFVQNKKANWRWCADGRQWLNQRKLETQSIQRSPLLIRPDKGNSQAELRVEDIEVSADRKYMYCKGRVRGQGSKVRSKVVVAVEWLDEDQKALNTDWKRIEMNLDGKTVSLLPFTLTPFIVKAPLDRRVKGVNAYAFTGRQ